LFLTAPYCQFRGVGQGMKQTYLFYRVPTAEAVLWNAMMIPLTNMTIYGVIWYQGNVYVEPAVSGFLLLYCQPFCFVFKLRLKLLRTKTGIGEKIISFLLQKHLIMKRKC